MNFIKNEIHFNNFDEIKSAKSVLRKSIKKDLADFALNKKNVLQANKNACEHFLQSEFYKNAPLIFCFISSGVEIDTFQIIERALFDNKKIVVPKVICGTNKMDFYYLEKRDLSLQTTLGAFGILEPNENLLKINVKNLQVEELKNAVLLFPGLAFDKSGNRLGKGKGFYDFFFEQCVTENRDFLQNVKRIGFCYSIQFVEKIPFDKNDIKMQFLITENGISKFSE